MTPSPTPLSYIEISKANLLHNVIELKRFANISNDSNKLCIAVVKANAYGHGLTEVVSAISDQVDYWQVDDLQEAEQLHSLTKKPIIVLGYIQINDLPRALELGLEFCAWTSEQLQYINTAAAKAKTRANVHISVDTQLGREGFLLADIPNIISQLQANPAIYVSGIYSHFSNIEDTSDFTHAELQLEEFHSAVRQFAAAGISPELIHISATSGSMVYETHHTDHTAIRIGIGMYGLWPSLDLQRRLEQHISLKPALRWISHVAQIKQLPADFPIGYGLTYVTTKPTTIAVIPQGYSDGYDRGLSNVGEVLIRGKVCTILGRVAMNMFVVDVTDVDGAEIEDEVILLGIQQDAEISAEDIATKISSINYEVVARISPLLPRKSI